MTKLHKGSIGPRITPIDWAAAESAPQYQPLWMSLSVPPAESIPLVDDFIYSNPGFPVKGTVAGAGQFNYQWFHGILSGSPVFTLFSTRLANGVGKYEFIMIGIWQSQVYMDIVFDAQPIFGGSIFRFDGLTPTSSFRQDPTKWANLQRYNFGYVQWSQIPP